MCNKPWILNVCNLLDKHFTIKTFNNFFESELLGKMRVIANSGHVSPITPITGGAIVNQFFLRNKRHRITN